MNLRQIITLSLWMVLIVGGILVFVFNPNLFTGTEMKRFIAANALEMQSFYTFVCVLRCLTIIPATPFIAVGVLLFPENLDFVMAVSTVTVLIAATVHFFFSRMLEFDKLLERKFANKMERFRKGMKKRGFLYVYLWTMAPFLPSDPIYYIAGISGMKYWRFISAVFLGGCVIIVLYVYMGKDFFDWVHNIL